MPTKKGTIFINYRKDDSNWNALALYNDLLKYFDKEQLFKDFNAILPGDDFAVSIQNALNKCNVLLVVIGRNWLRMEGPDGKRRLDDPDDFVRLEIATALERGVQVVPVLFDGTPMPKPEELPENLRTLCRRQFIEIDPKRFEDDVRNLAEALKKILPAEEPQPQPRPNPQFNTGNANRPQPQPNYGGTTPKPDNNLLWAILSTVLCCLPLGIVSIIHATKVDSLYNTGHYEEAASEAKKAKQWAIYSVIGAVICWIIYVMLIAVGALNSYNSYGY